MSLTKQVYLEINDKTQIIVDFYLSKTGNEYEIDTELVEFIDENGVFTLLGKPHDVQKELIQAAGKAIDQYIADNHHEMAIQLS